MVMHKPAIDLSLDFFFFWAVFTGNPKLRGTLHQQSSPQGILFDVLAHIYKRK